MENRNVHIGQVIHCSGTVFVGYDAIREDFFRVGEIEDGYFRACNLNGPSNWYSFNMDGTMRGDSRGGSEYGGFRIGNAWKTLCVVSFDSPLLRAMEILSGVDVNLEGISKIYSLLTKVKDAGGLKEHLVPQELRCVPARVTMSGAGWLGVDKEYNRMVCLTIPVSQIGLRDDCDWYGIRGSRLVAKFRNDGTFCGETSVSLRDEYHDSRDVMVGGEFLDIDSKWLPVVEAVLRFHSCVLPSPSTMYLVPPIIYCAKAVMDACIGKDVKAIPEYFRINL